MNQREKDKYSMFSLICRRDKSGTHRMESKMVVARGDVGQRVQIPQVQVKLRSR